MKTRSSSFAVAPTDSLTIASGQYPQRSRAGGLIARTRPRPLAVLTFLLLLLFIQQRAKRLVDGIGDDLRPFRVGMYAIGLIQRLDPGDAIKKERDERHLMLPR